MSLPKWIKNLTVKSGPCEMCGPKCNDADKLYEALTIALKALELMGCDCSPQYISGEHLSKCNYRVAKEALEKIKVMR